MQRPATDLPAFDLGVPGPQRDYLVAQVLSGEKTATSSLLTHWRADDEDLPTPGSRFALVDSTGHRGTVEITEVRLLRLADVTDTIAHAEGEGFQDAAAWRTRPSGPKTGTADRCSTTRPWWSSSSG